MCRLFLCLIAATILQTSCNPETNGYREKDGLSAFDADSLGKHTAELSGDNFEGRKPFTTGETKTIRYLKEKFIAAGLEPGNGESYFQEVPMANITTLAAPTMQVQSVRGHFVINGPEDYVIWTNKTDSTVSLNNDELVFAGYGVVAPEYQWNDYEGLDVKGKIVMVLVNDPGFNAGDSSLFKGKTMTYYGRWTYKFEEAARQGAKGCLVIHNTEAASYPFSVVQNNWNTSRLRLDTRGKDENQCDVIGWVSEPTAKHLFAAAGKDTALLSSADIRGFKGISLNLTLSTDLKVKTNFNSSNNVIGKITGSKFPDETIIYTAHWDHLGIGAPDESGDSIYNGAIDNAIGTAGLIELARGFKSMPTSPERTIVFLAVTAEEQGLWGSAYYAQNPVFPTKKTEANINMDAPNWYGKTKDLIILGQGQSELEDILQEESAKVNRTISPEAHPEAGYYYRSDHFNFAKEGIPSLFTAGGTDVIGKEPGYGKRIDDEYNNMHYHRPSDEYDTTRIQLDGQIEDLRLLFRLGRRLAYGRQWPQWKTGSEFKAIRDKQK